MTTPLTYRVDLMLGRILTRKITASSEDVAQEIAEYLYTMFGDRHFESDSESLMDSIVSPIKEEAAQ